MADHMLGFPRVCPVFVLLLAAGCAASATEQPPPQKNPANANVHANAQQAANLPHAASGMPAPPVVRAMSFKTSSATLKGWKITIPGQRPLATPAIADGKLFVGGGFGSHEFYAFDAATGTKVWQYQTGDDGPTAAIVADGYVIFNTESCELEVLTQAGKPVWKKRLGDPLMSMPAAQGGRIFMAYPDSKGSHQLVCFDLKSGTELWTQPIPGEVITSPVVQADRVLAATLEGTLRCFDQRTARSFGAKSKTQLRRRPCFAAVATLAAAKKRPRKTPAR
jgi:outer membrane protein assembly factor BamB